MCMKPAAFDDCSSLTSVTIIRHAQILCSFCFLECDSLSSISFERDSELTHIEAGACQWRNSSLVVVVSG
jgi:hypothetical protein